MFDLEKAILNWIRVLRRNPSFEDGDIVEIEDHIREEIENEHTNGLSLKQAFKSATSSFGSVDSIGEEMTRSRTKHLKIPHAYSLELEFPKSKNPFINSTAMFRNYLIIAIRNLMKQKLHSFINISGLAIGMVVSILILSYVWFEFSFDRFHSKSDQIYRVVQSNYIINESNRGTTGQGLASALKEEFPEIINIARLNDRWDSEFEISYKEKKIHFGASH